MAELETLIDAGHVAKLLGLSVATIYRYEILTKKIVQRLRELPVQGCESRGMMIVEGV
jgi:hypothetical protein